MTSWESDFYMAQTLFDRETQTPRDPDPTTSPGPAPPVQAVDRKFFFLDSVGEPPIWFAVFQMFMDFSF